ncbi:MAG: hypothetical protein ACJ77N_08740, partial [Chloroflexota bacterium]
MAQRRRRGFGVYTAEAVIMVLVVGLIFAGVFVGWIIGHYATNTQAVKTVTVSASAGSPSSSEDIQTAPNFSAADLMKAPTEDWPTVGGTL